MATGNGMEYVMARHWDAGIDFVSGIAGGTASVYVGQPLDTVKVKMQTFPHLYKNAFTCFAKTYRVEGLVRGLYAGTIPSLAAQVAENSILFMAYGMCQKGVMLVSDRTHVNQLNVVENALAGGSAAFFSSLALCPTELIKCRLQAMQEMVSSGQMHPSEYKNTGPAALTKQILKQEGIRGLFRGFIATLAREMPGYCFFFGAYELSRTMFTPAGKNKDDLGAFPTMISGAIGGMAFWASVFPADVIKSRLQVQVNSEARSFFSMMVHIARTEGVWALYAGLGPGLARTAPATAALFLAYENTKRLLSSLIYGKENS